MLEVIKFGGNTLRDFELIQSAADYVSKKITENKKIIIVTSAMGRIGDPYSTDTLKSLLKTEAKPNDLDRLLSVGETVSSIVFKSFLDALNVNNYVCSVKDVGIITDSNFNDANILKVEDNLITFLDKYDCVIVPGFQGINVNFEITTLGRGGSDTTAIVLASKYNADVVEIISDVPGILTADPKLVPNAKLVKKITYEQLIKITNNGCRVLHHKAALLSKKHDVKLKFLSLENPEHYTIIDKNNEFFNITYELINNKTRAKICIVKKEGETFIVTNISKLKEEINYYHDVYIGSYR